MKAGGRPFGACITSSIMGIKTKRLSPNLQINHFIAKVAGQVVFHKGSAPSIH